jgi:hypothetical protein
LYYQKYVTTEFLEKFFSVGDITKFTRDKFGNSSFALLTKE